MSQLTLLLVFGLLGGALCKPESNDRSNEMNILQRITSPDNRGIRPSQQTLVTVNTFLRDITRVDTNNQEIKASVIIRFSWSDPRLQYTGDIHHVTVDDPTKIWTPIPYFASASDAGKLDQEAQMVRVYRNGTVLFSQRRQMTLRCSPDFASTLGSGQAQCPIQIASYAYTMDHIKFAWRQDTPTQFMDSLQTRPNVQLVDFLPKTCDATTSTGAYSCLQGVIILKGEQITDTCIPVVYKPITHI